MKGEIVQRRTELLFWVLSFGLSTFLWSQWAFASLPSPNQPVLDSQQAKLSRIQGAASFEMRSTVVPMTVCTEGMVCPRSQVYWTLVVHSGQVKYEIARPFAYGSTVQPESLEVSGVRIRPGLWISLEGVVYSLMPNYNVVSDVRNITVVPDQWGLELPLGEDAEKMDSLPPSDSVWSPETEGWNCENRLGESTVIAQVWYGKTGANQEGYHLQVRGRPSPTAPIQDLAKLDQVQIRTSPNTVVFAGATREMRAMLAIRQTQASFTDFPSLLKIQRVENVSGRPSVSQNDQGLVCRPARYSWHFSPGIGPIVQEAVR